MPRLVRLDRPVVLHYAMGRCIAGRKIFHATKDRNGLIARLCQPAQGNAMAIYACALLPNHFRLLCKTKNQPLEASVLKALTGYVMNFKKRHRR